VAEVPGQWIAAAAAVGDPGRRRPAGGGGRDRAGFLFVYKTTGKVTGRIDWESYHPTTGTAATTTRR